MAGFFCVLVPRFSFALVVQYDFRYLLTSKRVGAIRSDEEQNA